MQNISSMNIKLVTIVCFLLCFFTIESPGQVKIDYDENFKDVFFDVSLNTVFGDENVRIKKWEQNVKIFIKNPDQKILIDEFEKIKDEINELSGTISLERVYDEAQANFVIFFSNEEEYSNYEKKVKKRYLKNNWAYNWIKWNSNSEIYEASMYVDIFRIEDIACQKHLLREKLTQSLGMISHCDKYENSIFFNKWRCTTSYSKMDKDLIRLFFSPQIKTGMNMAQICESLKWDFEFHSKRKLIATHQSQDITMWEYNDGYILKKEIIIEEDYSWSPSKCVLYEESEFVNKKWDKRVVLAAQRYRHGTTNKILNANPNIILYEGEPTGLLLYLNKIEEILILQPTFEDKYMMYDHQVFVNKSLGTPHINIYIGGKGWVTIGAKAVNRIKRPFLRWAKRQDIQLGNNNIQ